VLRYTRLEPKERRLPQAAEDYTVWYLSRLRSVEAALEDQEFLCAGRFTMADVAIHYALFLGETLGLAERYKPRSRDYLERLKARPAFRRAREKQAVRAD
jgi:glutathione S-transferase